ncbi:MAG: GNAT family N-acetyltransferase [bacterium]|nr:GNAT family N-acetyltransferase [bacterium]
MSIILKRATAKDVHAFLDIEQSIHEIRTYSAMTDPKEVLEEIEKGVVYLILEDEQIVGSVVYLMKTPEHAHIDGLIVRPEFQNRGIGTAAMVKVLEELKNVKLVDLVTHPDNERAIKLYESLGFTIGERIENYFGDGEPRIVMTLKHEK